jgi:hypothetical protein
MAGAKKMDVVLFGAGCKEHLVVKMDRGISDKKVYPDRIKNFY